MSVIDVSEALATIRIEKLHRVTKADIRAPRPLSAGEWPPNYDSVLLWRRSTLAKFELDPDLVVQAKAFYAKSENAAAFICHWCDTYDPRNSGVGDKSVWMPFVLFERQEALVEFFVECIDTSQPGLVEKCRTMGATWIGVALSVWMWLFRPGIAIGWGSQDAMTVDRIGDPKSIFWKIRELIKRLPPQFLPKLGPDDLKQYVCVNPENGASIVGEVGDNIGRGGRTRVYFKDESAYYKHPEMVEASLSETTRCAIDISSVSAPGHLFHRKRENGLDWYPGANLEKGYTRVFVMDWRDHPEYNQAWYNQKRAYHVRQGTTHVFAREIERDYAASIQGAIIPMDWIEAAVDAHLKLPGLDEGGWTAALDVGDAEDGDRNAGVGRKGVALMIAEEWAARDPGVTARKMLQIVEPLGRVDIEYDCIGVGVAVKAEANRLKDEGLWPRHVTLVPWNAGDTVLHPRHRVNSEDAESPINKDFFQNLKAQGWWELRGRFYRTWRAIVPDAQTGQVEEYSPDTLISLSSQLPLLRKIKKELSQPTVSKSSRMKLIIDKAPDGVPSPNLGDGIMMCYWPLPKPGMLLGVGPKVFVGGREAVGGIPR